MGNLPVFSTQGRLNRLPYNVYSLILLLIPGAVIALTSFLQIYLKAHANSMNDTALTVIMVISIVAFLIAILCFIAQVTLTVRRLHDLNLSGRCYFVYIVLLFFPSILYNEKVLVLKFVALAITLVTIILPLIIMFKKGTVGENKYGADPLAK